MNNDHLRHRKDSLTPILVNLQPTEIETLRADAHSWQSVHKVLRHRAIIDKIPLENAPVSVPRFTGKLIYIQDLTHTGRVQCIAEKIVIEIRVADHAVAGR